MSDRFAAASPSGTDLERRLREAGAEELLALVTGHLAAFDPSLVRQVARNPHCPPEVLDLLAGEERLVAFYEVRRDLALHPRTSEVAALRFVPGLYWRDLMELGLDTRVHPRVRRAADQYLLARLPQMALGERTALARRAGPGILGQLRHDPNPGVMTALFDNPRLTEDILAPVAHQAATPGPVLAAIAADRRWGARSGLRAALARNPNTPLAVALRLLPLLPKPELRALSRDLRVSETVRRRARVLLGEAEGG